MSGPVEDFNVGDRVHTPPPTMTEPDRLSFSALTGTGVA